MQTAEDWSSDTHRGRNYAASVIDRSKEEGSPLPICRAVRDIIERGEYDAVAVGFFTEIATRLMR